MKKIVLFLTMLVGTFAANAAVLSFDKANYEVVAGGTVVIPIQITFDASEAGKYKNIECKYTLSNADFTLTELSTAKEQLLSGSGIAYTTKIAGATLGVIGENPSSMINCVSGVLFYLTVSADDALSAGDECTLSIKDALGGDASYVETNFTSDISTKITVVDYVTIDENADFTPVATTKDVHLIRSFEAGKFYTLVLPFAANATKLAAAFGTAPTIYTFDGVSVDNDHVSEITFAFKTSAGMAANRPYIIKINQDCENPVFAGVTIKVGTTEQAITEEEYTFADVVFKGTYTPGTVIPAGGLYVKSDNAKLYASQGATKMKGTRAYIDISALGVTSVKAFTLNLDGEETGIESLDSDVQAQGWYDMNGRKLSVKPSTKGVYISNGKKVVVK